MLTGSPQTLWIRNRQRVRCVNAALLRRVIRRLLEEELRVTCFELAVHLVAAPEMARVNEAFLGHSGSTDVITFDHAGHAEPAFAESHASHRAARRRSRAASITSARPFPAKAEGRPKLYGELFVCLDEAVRQARDFGTSWQSELVRYVIHGLLHLRGHDDRHSTARRKMKREEDRILRLTAKRFRLSDLTRPLQSPAAHRST